MRNTNINSNITVTDLFDLAQQSLNDVQVGEVFIVRDLFRGFEWNRVPIGTRAPLGTMFYNYYINPDKTSKTGELEDMGKTSQNQQKYKKMC